MNFLFTAFRWGLPIIFICCTHFIVCAEELNRRTHSTSVLQINGKVIDEDTQEGLPGVNVLVKGTAIGTTTDINGVFFLDVPDANSILVFSFIGYRTKELTVDSRTQIEIALRVDVIVDYRVIQTAYSQQAEN